MKCEKCGNEIANDSEFCMFCGEKINLNENITNDKIEKNYIRNNEDLNYNINGIKEYNDGIKEYNEKLEHKRKLKKKIFIPLISIICLISFLIIFFNTKIGKYYTGKVCMNIHQYSFAVSNFDKIRGFKDSFRLYNDALFCLAKQKFNEKKYDESIENFKKIDKTSKYTNIVDVYVNYIEGNKNFQNKDYDKSNDNYLVCINKIGKNYDEYLDLDIEKIKENYNYGSCFISDKKINEGKLYDAFILLSKIDNDYIYNGMSVEQKIEQYAEMKNFVEMTGKWNFEKGTCQINPNNRFMDGWINKQAEGDIKVNNIKNGVISVEYNLPYIEKYSFTKYSLKYGNLTGVCNVNVGECNKWLLVDRYKAENLSIFVDAVNKKIMMKFRYSYVKTTYNDTLSGETFGEYSSKCITNMSSLLKNGWIGDYYYIDGKKCKNQWAQYLNDWYYLGTDGLYLRDKWVDNDNYYVDSNGKMLKNTMAPNGRYLDANGKKIPTLSEQISISKTVIEYPAGTTVDKMSGIKFGKYPQNGAKDDIEWLVLNKDVVNHKALLVSKYILDVQSYNNNSDASWSTSTVRQWLNDGFYNFAFLENEKKMIVETNIDVNSSMEKVFLLNSFEVDIYMKTVGQTGTKATTYAKNKKNNNLSIYVSSSSLWHNNNSAYWLRDKDNSNNIKVVTYAGMISSTSANLSNIGVRPAIWISY